MSSNGELQKGDRVFAQVKGYPAWPAYVAGHNGESGLYKVYFYGTYETGVVKRDEMVLYTPEAEEPVKCGKPIFKKALEEMEKNYKIDDFGLIKEGEREEMILVEHLVKKYIHGGTYIISRDVAFYG